MSPPDRGPQGFAFEVGRYVASERGWDAPNALTTLGHERCFDVVIHDERDAVTCTQASRRASPLDHVHAWHVLQTPLHDGRAALDRNPRGLQLVNECVELHEILARASSVSGSSAASAS